MIKDAILDGDSHGTTCAEAWVQVMKREGAKLGLDSGVEGPGPFEQPPLADVGNCST